MSAARGFRRLWVLVSALLISLCVGAGAWLGYRPAHTNYCPRAGGECQQGYPPSYENWLEFERDRERFEILEKNPVIPEPQRQSPAVLEEGANEIRRRGSPKATVDILDLFRRDARDRWTRWQETTDVEEVPARLNPREPLLGFLIGITGSALLYGIGSVIGWVVRGFRHE